MPFLSSLAGTYAFGRGARRIVTVSVGQLAVGTIIAGNTTTNTVTLTNTGSLPVTISSVNIIGTDAADFSVTGCTGNLPVGDSCTVTITFSPSTAGNKTATLSIAHNAIGATSTVALTSIALEPDYYYNNVSLLMHMDGTNGGTTFTDVKGHAVDSSVYSTTRVTTATSVKQFGTASAVFDGGNKLSVASSSDFAFGADDFTIEFWMKPSQGNGSYAQLLANSQYDVAGGWLLAYQQGDMLGFQLSGLYGAVLTSNSSGLLNSSSNWTHIAVVRYGNTAYMFVNGTKQTNTIDLTGKTFTSQSLSIGGQVTGINGSTCFSGNIDEVRLTKGYARYTNNFTVPTVPFAEEQVPVPLISLSGNSVSVASTDIGSTNTSTVRLTNTGALPLTISSLTLTGTNSADYSVSGCIGTLAAGNNCTITVTFAPTATGTRTASLVINSNAYNAIGGSTTVSLSSTATVSAPAISLSASSLTVTSTTVGQSNTGTITVNNTGTAPLIISGLTLTGTNAADYSVTGCAGWLPGGTSCTLAVTFTPSASGTRTATLSIAHNATGSPSTVSLSSTSVAPVISLSASSLTIDSSAVGVPTTGIITITNTGTAPLTVSNLGISADDTYWANVSLLLNMNGSTGSTTFTDATGLRTWTAVGSAQISTAQSKFGGASLYAIDANAGATTPSNSNLNIGTGDFTIECWVYLTQNTGSYPDIISRRSDGTFAGTQWTVSLAPGNVPGFNVSNGTGWVGGLSSGTSLSINQWHHLALARSSGTVAWYINGTQTASAAYTNSFETNLSGRSLCIANALGSYVFTGYIDDVRITNGVARYTANFTPPTEQLGSTTTNVVTDFSASGCSSAIAANGSCVLTVTFTPTATTSKTAYLVITHNATGSPTTVNLTGTVTALAPATEAYWEYTPLLLHMDGANGSTTFTDATGLNTVTAVGDAKISTTQSKFGGASGYFDGSSDYLTIPSSTNFNMGSGDFTVECWFYAPSSMLSDNAYRPLITIAADTNSSSNNIIISKYRSDISNNLYAGYYSGGWQTFINPSTTTIPTNAWTHVALVRAGSTWTLYVNGTSIGAASYSGAVTLSNPMVSVGSSFYSGEYWNGYIDEVRITKGIARYTGAFTPATSAFASAAAVDQDFGVTSLLMHMDGTNGSTAFIDATGKNTFTPAGSAQISTEQSKFGGASAKFTSSGHLSTPVSSNFAINTRDFTVEAWIYPTNSGAYQGIFTSGTYNTTQLTVRIATNNTLQVYQGAGGTYVTSSVGTISANIWTHVAVTRSSGTLRLFINGVLQATSGRTTVNWAANIGSTLTGSAYIAREQNYYFTGYIDEFRLTNGVARYTGDFALPTTASYNTASAINLDPYFASTDLLLHADGNNGSTTFTDATGKNTLTALGTAQISTAQSKFGGASALISGTGSGISVPYSVDFELGTSDFTIEFWVRFATTGSAQYVVTKGRSSPIGASYGSWSILLSARTLQWSQTYNDGSGVAVVDNIKTGIDANTWYHIAVVRAGTQLKYYTNGVGSVGSFSGQIYSNSSQNLVIGNDCSSSRTYPLNGYVDDLRITTGLARYAANFTPPTQAYPNSASLTSPVAGTTSVYFDGTGDYLSAPANALFNFGTENFTVEAWVLPMSRPASGQYQMIYDQWAGLSGSYLTGQWQIGLGNTGRVYVFLAIASTSATSILTTTTTIPVNTWTHVALARSGTALNLFINGKLDTATTIVSTRVFGVSTAPVNVGRQAASASQYWNGYIADLRATKGSAVYATNFTPPTGALTTSANTSLLVSASGTTIVDATGNSTITAVGDAKLTSQLPGQS